MHPLKDAHAHFEIILDLQMSCKNSIEFLHTLQPSLPNVTILRNHGSSTIVHPTMLPLWSVVMLSMLFPFQAYIPPSGWPACTASEVSPFTLAPHWDQPIKAAGDWRAGHLSHPHPLLDSLQEHLFTKGSSPCFLYSAGATLPGSQSPSPFRPRISNSSGFIRPGFLCHP